MQALMTFHWHDSIFILYNKKKKQNHAVKVDRISIYDMAPIILDMMGREVPSDMQGRVIPEIKQWIDE